MSETGNDDLVINVGETQTQNLIEKPSPENSYWQGIDGQRDNHDVYFHQNPLKQLLNDLRNRGSLNEAAGIIIGLRCRDSRTGRTYTEVTEYTSLPDNLVRTGRTRATITNDAWTYANEQREHLNNPNLRIVGWAHTHPGYGVFLSNNDDDVNAHFTVPGQLAVVFDPTAGEKESFGIFSIGGAAKTEEFNGRRVKFGHDFQLHRGHYLVTDTPGEPVFKITAEELKQKPEMVIKPEDIIEEKQPQIRLTKENFSEKGKPGFIKRLFHK